MNMFSSTVSAPSPAWRIGVGPDATHKLRLSLLLAVILLFMGSAVAAEESGGSVDAAIQSAAEIDYPPFSMVDHAGQVTGFSVELMRAALASMGRSVTFRTGQWSNVRGWLEQGEVVALPLVGRTPEREAVLDFTVPYMSLHGAIVVRRDETGIGEIGDLRGRTVAVMKGDNAEEFLRRGDFGVDIRTTATFADALQELADGQHDAVVVQRIVALRLIRLMGLTNLQIVDRPIKGFKQDFCFAVKEGDRDTLALLNEGLAIVVADGTYRHLHTKWFAAMELPRDRPIIVGGDQNFPPYEFLDEKGQPAGFNVDLTRAIARKMGIEVKIRLGRWPEQMRALQQGRIDVLQGMFYSPQRDVDFDFSQSHAVSHYVAVVRKNAGHAPENVEALHGMQLVVERGDILHDFVLEHGLEAQTTLVDDQEEALRQLTNGKHDCALVSRVTAIYLMQKHDWSDLEFGKSPVFVGEYGFATAHGQKALLAQFSEGLKALDESGEYRQLHDKWLGVYQDESLSLLEILRYAGAVIVPLLLILLASLAWSWSLRRRVAEKTKALQRSEEYQRAVIACLPVALYTIDLEGRVLTWNSSAERVFGWRTEDIVGKRLLTVPDDKNDEFDALRREVLEQDHLTPKELLRQRYDGTLVPISLTAAPVRNNQGDPVAILAVAEDITNRKANEKRIRWNRERDALLSDTAARLLQSAEPRAIVEQICLKLMELIDCDAFFNFLQDAQKNPLHLNAYAGIPRSEAENIEWLEHGVAICGCVARDCKPMVCEDIQNTDSELTNLVKSYGIQAYCCHPLMVQDRMIGTLSFGRKSASRFGQEEIDLMASVTNLVAMAMSRIETERVLRENEARLRAIFESAQDAIYLKDTDLRYTHCNKAMVAMSGMDRERLIGRTDAELSAPDDVETAVKVDRHVLAGHRTRKTIVRRIGDRERTIDISKSPILDADGNVVGLCGVARDITEVLGLREQIQQAQKMEAIGSLAGGIAHDFNNLLSVILGFAELALDRVQQDGELKECLAEIRDAGRRAATLTSQLLAFGRKQVLQPRLLDLNQVITGLENMFRSIIGENIALQLALDPDLEPVMADSTQIEQVLMNLVVNARDAMLDGGTLTLNTANIERNNNSASVHVGMPTGRYAVLTVSDTGIGMDAPTKTRIFEPFFTTKPAGKGTGLGLSTVYGIVRQSGGHIELHSEPGQGSSFTIYLPIATSGSAPIAVTAGLPRSGKGTETILLAEDEATLRKVSVRGLESAGYHVIPAANAEQALDIFRAHADRIDLLLTDVIMPGLNGRSLALECEKIKPGIKVIYTSGYAADAIGRHGILEEGLHFVAKPFTILELTRKVREVLDLA